MVVRVRPVALGREQLAVGIIAVVVGALALVPSGLSNLNLCVIPLGESALSLEVFK